MQDLTVVGTSADGTRLVLRSVTGIEFAVPIDDSLVAAVHAAQGSPSSDPPARLEVQMDGPLRPREIQARIRAGESPEELAAEAGTDVERVMVFARPVLAERAHIAERAQRASLRLRHGDAATRLLGDVITEHLREENMSPESLEWDSWRREDGRWTLLATLPRGDVAEFIFDAAGRYVISQNDTAQWLVRDEPAAAEPRGSDAPPARTPVGDRPRLVAAEPELPLGEDALDLVGEAPPSGRRADDWMATQASERVDADGTSTSTDDDDEAAEEQHERKPRRHRASVPSWDEIMFGSGPQE